MARADLILGLVKASRVGGDDQVRRALEALAADERAKNHTVFADRLLAVLQMDNGRSRPPASVPIRSSAGPLVAERTPVRCLEDVILTGDAEESNREDEDGYGPYAGEETWRKEPRRAPGKRPLGQGETLG